MQGGRLSLCIVALNSLSSPLKFQTIRSPKLDLPSLQGTRQLNPRSFPLTTSSLLISHL